MVERAGYEEIVLKKTFQDRAGCKKMARDMFQQVYHRETKMKIVMTLLCYRIGNSNKYEAAMGQQYAKCFLTSFIHSEH